MGNPSGSIRHRVRARSDAFPLRGTAATPQEKLAELRETVVIRERSGFEAAARLVERNRGKQVMDEIRGVVSSMRAEEERSLEERRRSQERQRRIAMVTGLAGLAVALGFLAIAAILMDRALRQRDQAYAAQRLAAIVESSGDAIIGKTLEGTITSWNSAATSMFGYSEAEAIGRHITLIVPPERLDEEEEVLRRLVRGEAIEHFETVRRHKNGQRVEVSLSISPIRDGKGRAVGASKVARDISERKRIEAERAALLVRERAARAEAEEANRTKDEFLAVLSHELRTPLNSVYGWARMLRAGQLSDADTTRALESIVRNSGVQIQLIDDLLDISRIHAGKMRLDVQTVDLKAVAEAALDVIRPAAVAKAIRIQTVLDPRAGPITGDPNRLQQVLWNLLTNAVKFTPKGGLVQLHLQRVNSHVEIVVSDTGEGIAPDLLPFIFERFRQADSSSTRPHAGLGLGLALVKYLVELHGGSTTAHSAGPGQGATFVVRLPLTVAQLPTEPTPRQHPTVPSALILASHRTARRPARARRRRRSRRAPADLVDPRPGRGHGADVPLGAGRTRGAPDVAPRRGDFGYRDAGRGWLCADTKDPRARSVSGREDSRHSAYRLWETRRSPPDDFRGLQHARAEAGGAGGAGGAGREPRGPLARGFVASAPQALVGINRVESECRSERGQITPRL